MPRVKLLMLAPNLRPGKLGTSGSPAFNQSSRCLTECVSGASAGQPVRETRAAQRRGLAATFVLRALGLHSLYRTCQRHSTNPAPSAPVSKQ